MAEQGKNTHFCPKLEPLGPKDLINTKKGKNVAKQEQQE